MDGSLLVGFWDQIVLWLCLQWIVSIFVEIFSLKVSSILHWFCAPECVRVGKASWILCMCTFITLLLTVMWCVLLLQIPTTSIFPWEWAKTLNYELKQVLSPLSCSMSGYFLSFFFLKITKVMALIQNKGIIRFP